MRYEIHHDTAPATASSRGARMRPPCPMTATCSDAKNGQKATHTHHISHITFASLSIGAGIRDGSPPRLSCSLPSCTPRPHAKPFTVSYTGSPHLSCWKRSYRQRQPWRCPSLRSKRLQAPSGLQVRPRPAKPFNHLIPCRRPRSSSASRRRIAARHSCLLYSNSGTRSIARAS